jgi:hypothetical protein
VRDEDDHVGRTGVARVVNASTVRV